MRTVDQYVLRVLADRWAAPTRTPSLLDVSRSGNGMAEEMARVGFRVTRITLEDWSLETVNERLAGLSRHFDAVVCREVLELVDDWQEVVGRAARRLKPGGVFVYGVNRGPGRRWLDRLTPRWLRAPHQSTVAAGDMSAILRRMGLLPREIIALGAKSIAADSTAYLGYSIMPADRPAVGSSMRWDFTGTGARWIAAARVSRES
jgi:SAM-dependent methyltransferase